MSSSILIVDDHPLNLQMLVIGLTALGHVLHVATNGKDALQKLANLSPDLILLDVVMPGTDGFALCEIIKANPVTADIPVIFLTALDDAVDKVRGLQLGGVDYITKPFSIEEVIARLKVHLLLREKQKQLENLLEQDRLRALHMREFRNEVLEQLQHDVKSPLTSIKNSIYLLKKHADPKYPKVDEYAQRAQQAVDEVIRMIGSLLDIARMEMERSLHFTFVPVVAFVQKTVANFQSTAELKGIHLAIDLGSVDAPHQAYFDEALMASVLENLISNAVKYTDPGGQISVRITTGDAGLSFAVADTGHGIGQEDIGHIFERFYRVRAETEHIEGTGLGLFLVKSIVEQHKGTIRVQSEPGKGSVFVVTIPQDQFATA